MSRARVLLTTTGRKSYLARSLGRSDRVGWIVAVDTDPTSPIRDLVDAFECVPPVSDRQAFIASLGAICTSHDIDCILPQNDRELLPLAEARGEFEKTGARVAGLDPALVETVQDKLALARWLDSKGYPTLETWVEYPEEEHPLAAAPIVEKSRFGQGSEGLRFHSSRPAGKLGHDLVVQPRVDGEEFNLDILRDAAGEVVAISIKKKLLMENGSTSRAESVHSDLLRSLGESLANDLGVFGSIDVDVLIPDAAPDCPYIIDINPRMGGGFPFTAEFFPAYVDYLLEVCMGQPVGRKKPGYEAGLVVCREYSFSTRVGPATTLLDQSRKNSWTS